MPVTSYTANLTPTKGKSGVSDIERYHRVFQNEINAQELPFIMTDKKRTCTKRTKAMYPGEIK